MADYPLQSFARSGNACKAALDAALPHREYPCGLMPGHPREPA